jgi:hypothetical protein
MLKDDLLESSGVGISGRDVLTLAVIAGKVLSGPKVEIEMPEGLNEDQTRAFYSLFKALGDFGYALQN